VANSRGGHRTHRKLLICVFGFIAFSAPILVAPLNAAPCQAHLSVLDQYATAPPIAYEYEVASIKPAKPGGNGVTRIVNAPDEFTATNVTVKMVVISAYGVQDYQVSGGPVWVNGDRYDIEAKMDGSVVEALQKLAPEQRVTVRQQMLQALLADRFKLTIQRTTKEMPVYTLVIAKSGLRLKEAKPDDTYPNGFHGADGRSSGAGLIKIGGNPGKQTMTGQAIPIAKLALT